MFSFAYACLHAQAIREERFDNIAVAGGVYYVYPVNGVQTKAPCGYKPAYISHIGKHGSRWLFLMTNI